MRFLLGGHTADMQGEARGIGILRAGEADAPSAGGPLAFEGEAALTGGSPSWLAWHPTREVVYAGLEGAGAVQAFRAAGGGRLVRWGAPVALGDRPHHLAVAPDGSSLVRSGDSGLVRVRLDRDGAPGDVATAPPARDPYADLDEGEWHAAVLDPARDADAGGAAPADDDDALRALAAAADALREAAGDAFAHLIPSYEASTAPVGAAPAAAEADRAVRASRPSHAAFLPGGLLAATDAGLDIVRLWRTGADGSTPRGRVVLPRGAAPGAMVWHPSGHLYVVASASCELYVLAPDAAGAWRIVAAAPLAPGLAGDTAASVALARDAEFAYVGLRGSGTVATLRVGGDGSSLSPVALTDTGVAGPVHHVVVRDTLLVAGRDSGEVTALTLDIRAGAPGRVRSRTAAPSPTCILPLR